MFGGKYPTSDIARSNSGSDSTSCANHVRGRMLAAGPMTVEQRLHLGHVLADFPYRLLTIARLARRPRERDNDSRLSATIKRGHALAPPWSNSSSLVMLVAIRRASLCVSSFDEAERRAGQRTEIFAFGVIADITNRSRDVRLCQAILVWLTTEVNSDGNERTSVGTALGQAAYLCRLELGHNWEVWVQ